MSELFGDVLGRFKASEDAEDLTPLIDDGVLRNGVVAWKSIKVSINADLAQNGCDFDDRSERWEWLWSCVAFDLGQFAVVAGARAQDARDLFIRLKGLRLIYPDGTINKLAKDLLQAIIMERISKAMKSKGAKGAVK